MSRQSFEEDRAATWQELEAVLDAVEKNKAAPDSLEKVPGLFRQVCADLQLAQYRMYGLNVCDRLNQLVIRCYSSFYRGLRGSFAGILDFVWWQFPNQVRREWRLFWLNMALFWLPFLAFIASAYVNPTWIQAVLGPDTMAQMDAMYGTGSVLEHERDRFGSNFMMFCFYIYNNVSIDFRIFAGGILACIGTIFYVVYNGIFLGAVTGYIHYTGNTDNFYGFVSGHSSFELIGMIIAGMAGFRLGLAILHPGRLSRKDALKGAARQSISLLAGAGTLTVMAAFVEGFWSPHKFPPEIEYGVGLGFWLLLVAYLLFAGRSIVLPGRVLHTESGN